MQDLKISLITVAFNAESTIGRCIQSVIEQNYKNIEYIIIDGGSTDNTIRIINNYTNSINIFISQPDNGIYDAMNKGIKLATGQVIGMLNADDFFTGNDILSIVADAFINNDTNIIYGDIDIINTKGNIIRKWRSGPYADKMFNWGWMPPHPAFYCKRHLFEKYGYYSLEYGTAADYELMLRFMHRNSIGAIYIPKVMVNMTAGGVSNKSLGNRVKSLQFDLKAMRNNNIALPALTLLFKPLRKVVQFLIKRK